MSTNTRQTWSGGCQCGAVRYILLETPAHPHLCHCRMCQKQFGNYFAALAAVRPEQFQLTHGRLKHFQSSSEARRGFCGDCGTPLTHESLSRPSVEISLGSLDRHSDLVPEAQYGIESREPFFPILPVLPKFQTGEDESGANYASWRLAIEVSNRQHPDHDTDIWPPKPL